MKMPIKTIIALLTIALALPAEAEKRPKKQSPAPSEQKVVRASRAEEPVTVDALLDESVWQRPASNGFTQSDPSDGARPRKRRTSGWPMTTRRST
jgi:hypothetical protein